jgi:hypothetical protein
MFEFLKHSGPENLNAPNTPRKSTSSGARLSSSRKAPPSRPDPNEEERMRKDSVQKAPPKPPSKGPLTVDSDDEDAELFGKKPRRKEESMADFLSKTGPPEERVQESPNVRKKSGFTSLLKKELSRLSASAPALNTTNNESNGGRKSIKLAVPNDPYSRTSSSDLGPRTPSKERPSREESGSLSPRTSSSPRSSIPRKQPSPESAPLIPHIEPIVPVIAVKRRQRPVPKTVVPERFDDKAPLKKVFKNLTRLNVEFLNVFEAKIDVCIAFGLMLRLCFHQMRLSPNAHGKSLRSPVKRTRW